jgi:Zn-dependent peptidase ImmA (M78 family)
VTYIADEDFERIARNWRVKLDVDDQLRPNMTDVIQRLKYKGFADYLRVPDALLPDKEANFNPHDRKLYIRESTYKAAETGDPRARWTIAHEIGHIALNHQQSRNRSSMPTEIERIAPTIRRDESQAHKFAAAFLAPFHRGDFSLEVTAKQLVDRFGISLPAAIKRVEELSRMYRRLHGIKRPLPQSVVDFLAVAQRKGHQVKTLGTMEFAFEQTEPFRYEGELCPVCNNFRMIRTGISMKCEFCGAITGNE